MTIQEIVRALCNARITSGRQVASAVGCDQSVVSGFRCTGSAARGVYLTREPLRSLLIQYLGGLLNACLPVTDVTAEMELEFQADALLVEHLPCVLCGQPVCCEVPEDARRARACIDHLPEATW